MNIIHDFLKNIQKTIDLKKVNSIKYPYKIKKHKKYLQKNIFYV